MTSGTQSGEKTPVQVLTDTQKQINAFNTELEDSTRVTEELQQAFAHWLPDVSGKSPLYDCTTVLVVHLIYCRFPKALKDIQDKTSFTDADAKTRAKNTEELHQAHLPSKAVTSWFRAGFLSKASKVGSQALSGLGGHPEEDEFV